MGCIPWGRYKSVATERLHFHFSLSCHGEGNGNPLQYSCLENPMDRGACQATVHGATSVGHDIATKPPPQIIFFLIIYFRINISIFMYMCVFIYMYIQKNKAVLQTEANKTNITQKIEFLERISK